MKLGASSGGEFARPLFFFVILQSHAIFSISTIFFFKVHEIEIKVVLPEPLIPFQSVSFDILPGLALAQPEGSQV